MGKHSTELPIDVPVNTEPLPATFSAPKAASTSPRTYGAIACLLAAASLGVVAVASNPESAPVYAAALDNKIEVVTTAPIISHTYSLTVDGTTTEYTTEALTWRDALAEAGVTYDIDDIVSVSLAGRPTDGEEVTIQRVSHETIVEENIEKHTEVRTEDPNLDKGVEEVRTEGQDGKVQTTFNVTIIDGKQVEKERLVTVRFSDKVDRVIAVGTKEEAPEPQAVAPQASAQQQASAPAQAAAPVQVTAGGSRGIAQQMLAARGWGADQFRCLDSLWMRESNWNHLAMNPSSGAYGIPQSLPGSKMASHGADWRTNPATQIAWGLDYIAGRYGTPCGALNHSHARGWY